jgi:uncharacterized protein (TIGR03437 family)
VDSSGTYVGGYIRGAALSGGSGFIRKFDSGVEIWNRQVGSDNAFDEIRGVVASDSDVYVAGSTLTGLAGQTNSGSRDAFIRKYDPDGSELWTRQFGSSLEDRAYDIAADTSGLYVVGYARGALPGQTSFSPNLQDAFIRKYDRDGSELWTQQFGTSGVDEAWGVAANETGVYLVGNSSSFISGPGGEGLFVRRYDADGNILWTRQFGIRGDVGGTIVLDSSAVYVGENVAGTSIIRKFDLGGNLLWTREAFSSYTFGLASGNSGLYVAGIIQGDVSGQVSAGFYDGFVRKYNPAGTEEWTRLLGSVGTDSVQDVAVSASGVYVAGVTQGTLPGQTRIGLDDAFLAKFNETPGCFYANQPSSLFFPQPGGSGTVAVFSPSACAWTATSNSSFISIRSGSSGIGNGTVRYDLDANPVASLRTGTMTVAGQTLAIIQGPPPVIFEGGIVNGASFALHPAPVAPGSIISVFGNFLNDGSFLTSSRFGPDGRLVRSLGNATVTFSVIRPGQNGTFMAPIFASLHGTDYDQLAVQVPYELNGERSATVWVTARGYSSPPRTVNLDLVAPGIFSLSQDGRGAAVLLHQDGITPVTQEAPARLGEVVVLYATGLGIVAPSLAAGEPAQGPLRATVATPTVLVDGTVAEVHFSGVAPGLVGLNQINFRIPPNTRSAPDIPLVLSSGGSQSNIVTIAIAQ